jgi:hypothetical protein
LGQLVERLDDAGGAGLSGCLLLEDLERPRVADGYIMDTGAVGGP